MKQPLEVEAGLRGALAGSESAAEHLRNALMLLNQRYITYRGIGGREFVYVSELHDDIEAVRRRVAAALALLEEGK